VAPAWRGVAQRGVAQRGVAQRGVAWRGVAWRGVVWCGVTSSHVTSREGAAEDHRSGELLSNMAPECAVINARLWSKTVKAVASAVPSSLSLLSSQRRPAQK